MVMTLLTRPKKTVGTVIVATDGSGDTTDIQTGIDLLPATGGVVYIKEGVYTITEEITITTDNVSIIGAGRSTEIRIAAPGPATQDGINCGTQDGIIIQNLYIIGVSNQSWGITILGNYCLVDHCWVENMIHGIHLLGYHNTISNNFTYSNLHNGIWFYTTNRCIVSNNQVYENIRGGIIVGDANDNVISNNVVYHNDVNDTASYDGIWVGANSNNNVITDNRCRDNNRYEINISEAGCDKNIVIGNICLGTHTGAINDAGTNTHPNGASGTNNLALDDLNIIA